MAQKMVMAARFVFASVLGAGAAFSLAVFIQAVIAAGGRIGFDGGGLGALQAGVVGAAMAAPLGDLAVLWLFLASAWGASFIVYKRQPGLALGAYGLAGAAALIFWLAFVSSSQSVQAIAGLARWGMLASYACAGVGGGAVFAFQIGWRPRA